MSDTHATVLSYIISMVLLFSYVARIEIRRHRIQKEARNCNPQARANKKVGIVSELKPPSKVKAS